MGDDADVCSSSWLRKELEAARKEEKTLEQRMKDALVHLDAVRNATSRAISQQIRADLLKYREAMLKLDEGNLLHELNRLFEKLLNHDRHVHGHLAKEEEVMVVHDAKLRRAMVVDILQESDGGEVQYQLQLWSTDRTINKEYEEGFIKKVDRRFERRELYRASKPRQQLSTSSEAREGVTKAREAVDNPGAKRRVGFGSARVLDAPPIALAGPEASPRPNDAGFLLLLLADAERAAERLHDLKQHVEKAVSGALGERTNGMVAEVKRTRRATVKALEKYGGDYSRLTDLARMTFECDTMSAASLVLETLGDLEETGIKGRPGYRLLAGKNRLMLEFDANPAGGYRDVLLNLRCLSTWHIIEVQSAWHIPIAVQRILSSADSRLVGHSHTQTSARDQERRRPRRLRTGAHLCSQRSIDISARGGAQRATHRAHQTWCGTRACVHRQGRAERAF